MTELQEGVASSDLLAKPPLLDRVRSWLGGARQNAPSEYTALPAGAGALTRRARRSAEPTNAPAAATVREPVRNILIALAVFAVAIFIVAGATVAKQLPFSPLDEETHLDYAYELAHGELPHDGVVIDPEILSEWSCYGQSNAQLPACGTAASPSAYPALGEQYNSFHPPVYYFITGWFARIADHFDGPHTHFVFWDRAFGMVWCLAGAMVFFFALRAFRVSFLVSVLVGLIAVTCNQIQLSTVYATNDAAAFLGGAFALWVLARVLVQHKWGWLFPGLITLGLASTKTLNALALLVVAAVLVLAAVFPRLRPAGAPRLRLVAIAASIVAAVMIQYFGWSAIQNARATPGWVNPIGGANTGPFTHPVVLTLVQVAVNMQRPFGALLNFYAGHGTAYAIAMAALGIAVFVVPYLLIARSRLRTHEWLLAAAALIGSWIWPLVVNLQEYVARHEYFTVPTPRYGLTTVILALGVLAVVLDRVRRPLWLGAGTGAYLACVLVAEFM